MIRSAYSHPSVTVHFAQSLDGQIATCTGDSQWISSEATLTYAHQLRAAHDVVLVGVGTVIADDPLLTVRLAPGRSPSRAILDSQLRIPIGSKVLVEAPETTIVVTSERATIDRQNALRNLGVSIVVVPADTDGRVNLPAALRCLRDRGLDSVLVEGGSETITSFLRHGLVTRLSVCIAPIVVGTGIPAVGDLGIRRLGNAQRFRSATWRHFGDEVVLEAEL